jgi:hypothetical protein
MSSIAQNEKSAKESVLADQANSRTQYENLGQAEEQDRLMKDFEVI